MLRLHRTVAAVLALAALSLLVPDLASANAEPQHRSDGMVRLRGEGQYLGDDIYNSTGVGQSRTKRIGRTGAATYYVMVQNDGIARDSFTIRGSRGNRRFRVRYFTQGRDVTRALLSGGIVFRDIAPGSRRALRVAIQTQAGVPVGSRITANVTATSIANGTVDLTKSTMYRPSPYSRDQVTVHRQINGTRGAHGRRGLRMNPYLAKKAQRWAQQLAWTGRLAHSNLRSGAPSNWRALAENVGYGSDLTTVHRSFLRSRGHRANIMGNYTHVGTGVARTASRVYIVHVFMRV